MIHQDIQSARVTLWDSLVPTLLLRKNELIFYNLSWYVPFMKQSDAAGSIGVGGGMKRMTPVHCNRRCNFHRLYVSHRSHLHRSLEFWR